MQKFKANQNNAAKLRLVVACILAILCATTILNCCINDNTLSNYTFNNLSNIQKFSAFNASAEGGEQVYLSGKPIGISIRAEGLIVEGVSKVSSKNGEVYPAAESDIRAGDILCKIDGESVNSIYQLKVALERSNGFVELALKRDGQEFSARILPAVDNAGQKRIGLALKEDIGGVGTLTFVTKSGKFAALGHYIADPETGVGDELNRGQIFKTEVESVIKGQKGSAGGLVADVNRLQKPIGYINDNSLIGIYGDYIDKIEGELYRVAGKGEAKPGAAQVLATIEGDAPALYDVDIVKVISQSAPAEKGMVIAVKDKRLLEKTGGIVQGMSGSPIIQNGVFVGAVTHVFLQDPTRGYAVHSRFMYEYALRGEEVELQQAA